MRELNSVLSVKGIEKRKKDNYRFNVGTYLT